ncbi:MAG TPA: NADH:ubiquinone reductase (Na(+)-transporting) subunit C [Lentisphaeria bacterium]|nr:NADH:ubiquinone reductase (Na(+)-transporting) subunit C [Lentisphaeria bacterium]
MRSGPYTVVFVSAIAIVCSLLLSTAATLLRDRQDQNEALSKKENILKAFGVTKKMDGAAIDMFFTDHVELFAIDLEGNIDAEVDAAQLDMEAEDKKTEASSRRYPIYRCTIENEVIYCVPIIGRGLWSKLYGYLSLESDLNTVKGITFYKHGETPGLGAEIEKDWFQDNFLGKTINDQTGTFVSIEVVKGRAVDAYAGNEEKLSHAVDGISGATITSRGVTKMLHEDLTKYVPYFKKLEAN